MLTTTTTTTTAPLTADQLAALARLANRATRYEVAVIHPDGSRALVSYTPRNNQRGLRAALWDRRDQLATFLRREPAGLRWDRTLMGFHVEGGGMIRLTGRTQRQAIMEGRLPALPAKA